MTRHFRTLAVTLGLLGLLASAVPARDALARPSAQGTGLPSPCLAVRGKTAGPPVLLLGETVDITLTASAICAAEIRPLHIALVLDGSASMAGEPSFEQKQGARELIKSLDLRNNPLIRIGVVSYSGSATILCHLTDNASRASGCVGKVGAAGGSSIASGVLAGIQVLAQGRRDQEVAADIREVLLVVADGPDDAECGPVERAAGQAKGQGMLVISLSGGPDADVPCMRSIASSPRYSLEPSGPEPMAEGFVQATALLQSINSDFREMVIAGHSVTDRLPPNMAYVPGSAVPPPSAIDASASVLTWRFAFMPPDGVTITLRVRPLEAGYHPTNAGATGVFTDTRGRTVDFAFPDPWVSVLAALTPQPTPTGGSTPTATASPTATPSPTNVASPTSVRRGDLFFPNALRDEAP